MGNVGDRVKERVAHLQDNLRRIATKETLEQVADRTKGVVQERAKYYTAGVDAQGNKVSVPTRLLRAKDDASIPVCSGSVGYLPRLVSLSFVCCVCTSLVLYIVGAGLFNLSFVGLTVLWILHIFMLLAACHVVSCFCCQTAINTWWCHSAGFIAFLACAVCAACPFCWWAFVWVISLPICSENLGGEFVAGCVGVSMLTWATFSCAVAMTLGVVILGCFLALSIIDVVRTVKTRVKKEMMESDAATRIEEEKAWATATVDYDPAAAADATKDVEAQWGGVGAVEISVLSDRAVSPPPPKKKSKRPADTASAAASSAAVASSSAVGAAAAVPKKKMKKANPGPSADATSDPAAPGMKKKKKKPQPEVDVSAAAASGGDAWSLEPKPAADDFNLDDVMPLDDVSSVASEENVGLI